MILQVVAVRDRQADAFMRPMFAPTVGLVVRSFSDEVNRADKDNPMFNHPEDYELFLIGTFDEESGRLESATPKSLALATNVKAK